MQMQCPLFLLFVLIIFLNSRISYVLIFISDCKSLCSYNEQATTMLKSEIDSFSVSLLECIYHAINLNEKLYFSITIISISGVFGAVRNAASLPFIVLIEAMSVEELAYLLR